jgi:hypothetical protein
MDRCSAFLVVIIPERSPTANNRWISIPEESGIPVLKKILRITSTTGNRVRQNKEK